MGRGDYRSEGRGRWAALLWYCNLCGTGLQDAELSMVDLSNQV